MISFSKVRKEKFCERFKQKTVFVSGKGKPHEVSIKILIQFQRILMTLSTYWAFCDFTEWKREVSIGMFEAFCNQTDINQVSFRIVHCDTCPIKFSLSLITRKKEEKDKY